MPASQAPVCIAASISFEGAFAHRRELRVGLDQRGVRIDLGGDLAARALGDFGGEHAAKPVAEITLLNGAARELMRNFQRGGGMGGAGAEAKNGGCGERGCDDKAACEHGLSAASGGCVGN